MEADQAIKARVLNEWGEKAARHMHLTNGFSIAALRGEMLAGLISTYWREFPTPLNGDFDAYIDILAVNRDFRRNGMATQLIEISMRRAKQMGMRQIRAWSSEDKIEAIHLWKALGFGLCPTTIYPKGRELKGYSVVKVL
jgi:ribosomal protein S18 acetylase RimI-like enzyme